MVDITAIHIHYSTVEGPKGRKRGVKVIKNLTDPQDKLAIEHDIALEVRKLRNTGKYEYYYVVLQIDRGGKPAYRTVTHKIMF